MKPLRKLLTVLIALFTMAAGMLFALRNSVPVSVDFLVYTFEPQSIALWILGALALGGLLGMVVSAAILLRTRASLDMCRRQLDRTRAELGKLRSEGTPVRAA